jgi:hypothetical protein
MRLWLVLSGYRFRGSFRPKADMARRSVVLGKRKFHGKPYERRFGHGVRVMSLNDAQARMNLIDRIALLEAVSEAVNQTARKTVDRLSRAGVPVLVTGGLAVNAYGYDLFTRDVDLIVPDVETAHQFLLSQGYRVSVPVGVVDPETGTRVDLLPGGQSRSPRCPVNFPVPTTLGYNYVTLADLVSTKLGSYLANPIRRLKDKAAVIEFIKNGLARDIPGIDPAVQRLYHQTWDEIAAEPEGPRA